MSRFLMVGVVSGLIVGAITQIPRATPAEHPELKGPGVDKAATILKNVLTSTNERKAESFENLVRNAQLAGQKLPEQHYAARTLRLAIDAAVANTDKEKATRHLREKVKSMHESLTFRPLMESEPPKNFPPFTPLHKIEVKKYPPYRMARAGMNRANASENSAFWPLFRHIKRHQIAMTAPVQVDYASNGKNASETSMAFLYPDLQTGVTGKDNADANVEVLDIPEQTVVAIGVRGSMTDKKVRMAHQKLLNWLKQNSESYEIDGALRRMGYNSPFVPESQRFFEVQLPVRRKDNRATVPNGAESSS